MDNQYIQSRLSREPFRPFIIELASDRQIAVSGDYEVLFPRKHPDRVYVFTEDGHTHEFDVEAVRLLVVEPG
jgi:hypothetical protein